MAGKERLTVALVTAELRRALEDVAERENRTVSSMARILIEEGLEARGAVLVKPRRVPRATGRPREG